MKPTDDIFQQLVRDVEKLKTELLRIETTRQQFTVLNQTVYRDVTGTENNLAVGDYDFITLNPTANRTINGMTGGVRGRLLWVRNVSASFTLTFTHLNASATSTNQILTASGASVVLGTRQTAIFEYMVDSTLGGGSQRWWLLIPYA